MIILSDRRVLVTWSYLFVIVATGALSHGCDRGTAAYRGNQRGYSYSQGGPFVGGSPSINPSGDLIVFASPEWNSLGDIWSVGLDGSCLTNLTQSYAYDGDPVFSPDGTRIVYVSERDGNGEIYSMKVDGTDQRRLTHNGAYDYHPVYSASGEFIAFTRSGARRKWFLGGESRTIHRIYVIRSDGAHLKMLVESPYPYIGFEPLGFSSDGNAVIFKDPGSSMMGLGICSVPVDGGEAKSLGKVPMTWNVALSRDGKKIVFVESEYNDNRDFIEGSDALYLVDVGDRLGKSRQRITQEGESFGGLSFTADMTGVFGESQSEGNLYIVDLADQRRRKIDLIKCWKEYHSLLQCSAPGAAAE